MLLQIAWKNIWRNKVRSLVILTAIALGIFAGVFNMAFFYGMVEQRIETVISTEASHIQIHQKNYVEDPEIKKNIEQAADMANSIGRLESVKQTTCRTIINAMISSAESGSGIRLLGINPEDEMNVTDISSRLLDGKYLEGIKRNPILIGEKLAEKLGVKLRSKVVVTLQDLEGEMIYASFRVAGIYKTTNTTYDEMTAFVRKTDLENLTGLPGDGAHEIAILLNNSETLDSTMAYLRSEYPDLDIKSWRDIMPEVGLIEESMDVSMYVFMGIILFALLFGIINTMLMAVLERRKELGMLMAVGMNKRRVFSMITLETIVLSLTGGVFGILMGGLFTFFLSQNGIDLSNWGWSGAYESLGYDTVVYPLLKSSMLIRVTIMVIITGFIGSLYPARKALKLNPAEAIRIDI